MLARSDAAACPVSRAPTAAGKASVRIRIETAAAKRGRMGNLKTGDRSAALAPSNTAGAAKANPNWSWMVPGVNTARRRRKPGSARRPAQPPCMPCSLARSPMMSISRMSPPTTENPTTATTLPGGPTMTPGAAVDERDAPERCERRGAGPEDLDDVAWHRRPADGPAGRARHHRCAGRRRGRGATAGHRSRRPGRPPRRRRRPAAGPRGRRPAPAWPRGSGACARLAS